MNCMHATTLDGGAGGAWPILGQQEQATWQGWPAKMLTWHRCDALFVLVKILKIKGP